MDGDSDIFIRFCGKLVFGDGIHAWDQLTGDQQEQFCGLAQQNGWAKLFLCVLGKRLPAAFFQRMTPGWQKESVKRLIEEEQLKTFYSLLEKEKIPFMPVKGADLAFHVYPNPALRTHGDWDIMFHDEDCPRVLELLQKHGWQTVSGCDQEENTDHHHFERMHNGFQALEVHRNLPEFGSAVPEEIWKETVSLNKYHRVLTPEMNLLLIAAHASAKSYTHVPEWKILMDAGYIMQHDSVDWQKVHRMADHWGLLRPDILFNTWSEFFPEGMLPAECLNPEHRKLFREIFSMRTKVSAVPNYEKMMNIPEHHDLHWFMQRLRNCFKPRSICLSYHVKPHSPGKILFYGCYDILKKLFYFLKCTRSGNPVLLHHYQNVEAVEKLIRHEK